MNSRSAIIGALLACLLSLQCLSQIDAIIIYSGEGADSYSVAGIKKLFATKALKFFPLVKEEKSFTAIIEAMKKTENGLLIMPGGSAFKYNGKFMELNPGEKQDFKDLVSQRWSYWGICAGAYFASTNFHVSIVQIPDHIIPAKGCLWKVPDLYSAFDKFDPCSAQCARAVKVRFRDADGSEQTGMIVWNGGPSFSESEKVSLPAKYMESDAHDIGAMAVLNLADNAKMVLSGVHPEYNRADDGPAMIKGGCAATEVDKLDPHHQIEDALFKLTLNELGMEL